MEILNYILDMGGSVVMPIIITIIGLIFGQKFSKAFRSGMTIGIGLKHIVTALLQRAAIPIQHCGSVPLVLLFHRSQQGKTLLKLSKSFPGSIRTPIIDNKQPALDSRPQSHRMPLVHHGFNIALLIVGRNHDDQPVSFRFGHTAPL